MSHLPTTSRNEVVASRLNYKGGSCNGIDILIEAQLTNLSPHCGAKHELTSPFMQRARCPPMSSRLSQRSHQGVGDGVVLRHG